MGHQQVCGFWCVDSHACVARAPPPARLWKSAVKRAVKSALEEHRGRAALQGRVSRIKRPFLIRNQIPKKVSNRRHPPQPSRYNLHKQPAFGGCYQWVLGAVCQTVEWLNQPLGFDSLALRGLSTSTNTLDKRFRRTIIMNVWQTASSSTQLRLTIGAVLFPA
jgi:hypothetical protein